MKNKLYKLCVFLLLTTTLSACQPAAEAVTEVEIQQPVEIPAPKLINEDNAGQLEVILSESISTGAVNISWTADGSAFWAEDLYTALLHDGETAEEIARFVPGMYSAIYDTSSDGKTVAYAVETEDIRLYDLDSESDKVLISTGFPYSTAFFSPDGKTLAVPSMMDIKVVFYDTTSGEEIGSVSGFSTAAPVYNAKYSPDGKSLLWFARGTVQPMKIASQQMGPVLSHEDFVTYQEVSPDGKVIATTAAGMVDGEYQPLLTLWNAKTGDAMAQIAMPEYYTAISFSPDSALIATGSASGLVIFTSPFGEEVGRYETSETITDLAFSPDGKKLVTVSEWGLLQMYAP